MPNENLLTFLILLIIVVIVGAIAFTIYRILRPKLKEEKPSEEEILSEEMNRILKPIDDNDTAKEVSEYKNEEDE